MTKTLRVDTKPITRAFQKLRKHGYFAEKNWYCCQTCAVDAVPEENAEKYVVYCGGYDAECLKESGSTFLSWAGDDKFICDTLKEAGLKVDHDGSTKRRIWITLPNSTVN